jgi:hypothetical protein
MCLENWTWSAYCMLFQFIGGCWWYDSSNFMNEDTRKVWKILNTLLKTEVIQNEMLVVALCNGLSNVAYI